LQETLKIKGGCQKNCRKGKMCLGILNFQLPVTPKLKMVGNDYELKLLCDEV